MKKLNIILLMLLFLFTGCSDVYVNDGVPRNEAGGTLINDHTNSIKIEDYFNTCTHEFSYGDDCYVVKKFGESSSITTVLTPVTNGNVYQTPSTLTTLDIVSTSAADTYGGAGAWAVEVQGLSTNWTEVSETVNLSGLTPVQLQNQFYRIYRMKVVQSGTYANQTIGSHTGNIDLRGVVGNELWATITINGIALGQSEIGVFTVPAGYHAHLGHMFLHNDGNKVANVYMFVRENANKTTAPYDTMRVQFQVHGLISGESLSSKSIGNGIVGPADIGFMALINHS